MTETVIHLILLLIAASPLLIPLVWKKDSTWVDPLALFGGTVLVFAFGKYLYLTFARPLGDQPPWAVAAELHNGVWATLLFSLLATSGYVLVRAQFRAESTARSQLTFIDMRLIYLLAGGVVALSIGAFMAILNSSTLSISWETISAKRFLDNVLGPASRVGTSEYFLFRMTLAARLPLYALFAGALIRRRFYLLDVVLIVICFLCIFMTAFIFSNRFNLLLVFIDLCALTAIVGRRSIAVRHIVLGIAVFAAIVVTSEFRIGEGRDMTLLEHVYQARSFTDIERTDKIVDYYQINEKEGGASFYNWLFIGLPQSYGDGGLAFLNMGWDMGYRIFGRRASGVPPGYLAETYMNFGLAGLLLGGFLFGISAAYIALSLQRRSHPPWLSVFVALVAVRFGLVLFNGNFGTTMIKIGLEALPVALLLWFAGRGRREHTFPVDRGARALSDMSRSTA